MSESGTEAAVLVDRILNGGDRDLQILAADGSVPLAACDVTALQLSLRLSDDPEVSSRASRSLAGTDPRRLCEVVEDAEDEVLRFLCSELAHPLVVTAVLQRAALNGSFLVSISSGLAPDLQELLLLRQEDICTSRDSRPSREEPRAQSLLPAPDHRVPGASPAAGTAGEA